MIKGPLFSPDRLQGGPRKQSPLDEFLEGPGEDFLLRERLEKRGVEFFLGTFHGDEGDAELFLEMAD